MVAGRVLLGFLNAAVRGHADLIFIHSLGGTSVPLQDSLGLHLIRDNGSAGKLIGRFKGVSTAFGMLAGLVVFIGFRSGFFSFTTPVKTIFIFASVLFLAVLILLVTLMRLMPDRTANRGDRPQVFAKGIAHQDRFNRRYPTITPWRSFSVGAKS
jgi:hypothetical protein